MSARATAEQWQLEYVEAAAVTIDPRALSLLPPMDARRLRAVPLALRGTSGLIALAEPSQERFEAVRELTGASTKFAVVSEQTLEAMLASRLFSERQPNPAGSRTAVRAASPPIQTNIDPDTGAPDAIGEATHASKSGQVDDPPPPAATTPPAPTAQPRLDAEVSADPERRAAAPDADSLTSQEQAASSPAPAAITPPAPGEHTRANGIEHPGISDPGTVAAGVALDPTPQTRPEEEADSPPPTVPITSAAPAVPQLTALDNDALGAVIAAVLERLTPQIQGTDPGSQRLRATDEHASDPLPPPDPTSDPPPTTAALAADLERAQQALREAKEELAAAHAHNDQHQQRIHALEAELAKTRELTGIARAKLNALARLLNPDTSPETPILIDDL